MVSPGERVPAWSGPSVSQLSALKCLASGPVAGMSGASLASPLAFGACRHLQMRQDCSEPKGCSASVPHWDLLWSH